LKEKPAARNAEMVNEDSLFFWTSIPKATTGSKSRSARAIFEKKFGDWLLQRYPGQNLKPECSRPERRVTNRRTTWPPGASGFSRLGPCQRRRTKIRKAATRTPRGFAELQLAFYDQRRLFARGSVQGVVSA